MSEEDPLMPAIETRHETSRTRRIKLLAVVCVYLFSLGSHYEAHLFATIKGEIKKELTLSNLQFHLLSAVVSFPNSIVPFIGGIIIDFCGVDKSSVAITLSIFLGSVLACVGLFVKSFYLLIVGRFMYGIGQGCVVIIQETILVSSLILFDLGALFQRKRIRHSCGNPVHDIKTIYIFGAIYYCSNS
jgi:MFS family permease